MNTALQTRLEELEAQLPDTVRKDQATPGSIGHVLTQETATEIVSKASGVGVGITEDFLAGMVVAADFITGAGIIISSGLIPPGEVVPFIQLGLFDMAVVLSKRLTAMDQAVLPNEALDRLVADAHVVDDPAPPKEE